MLRLAGLLIFVAALPTSAHAEDFQDKLCVLYSAEKLPVIQGLTITASRVLPAADSKKRRRVELDIKAAGTEATLAFLCGMEGTGLVVAPIGIAK